jgi:small subunit ribosomal protein S13
MRVLGITIPENKRLEIGLTALFGIGRSRAKNILKEAGIDFGTKAKDLTPEAENKIKKIIENFKIEGDLRRDISANIKRLKDIKSYRGLRHIRLLPSKGQRTKTNSRTRRGNIRRTAGTGRRTVDKK